LGALLEREAPVLRQLVAAVRRAEEQARPRLHRQRQAVAQPGAVADAVLLGLVRLARREAPDAGARLQLDAGVDAGRLLVAVLLRAAVGARADVHEQFVAADGDALRRVAPGGEVADDDLRRPRRLQLPGRQLPAHHLVVGREVEPPVRHRDAAPALGT